MITRVLERESCVCYSLVIYCPETTISNSSALQHNLLRTGLAEVIVQPDQTSWHPLPLLPAIIIKRMPDQTPGIFMLNLNDLHTIARSFCGSPIQITEALPAIIVDNPLYGG